MSAIDITIDKIIAEKNEAIAKIEWWRKEAERWRSCYLNLSDKTESSIESLNSRLITIERKLKQFTDIDL